MKLIGNITAFIVLGISGLAQPREECHGTTYDMSVCLSKIYERSDAELNTVYRDVLRQFSDSKRHTENLRVSERRWIAYRDAQCKAQYDLFEGGTGGPLENLRCLIEMTHQRTAKLKQVYLSPR